MKGEEEEMKSTSLLKQAALPGSHLHLHTPAALGKGSAAERLTPRTAPLPDGSIHAFTATSTISASKQH